MMQYSWPGARALVVIFSFIVLVGQAICIMGISHASILLSVMGSIFMGAGTGCCVMIQRSTVTQLFQNTSAVALGFCVGVANIGKTFSRISMAFLCDWSGDFLTSLYFELIPCLLSVFVAIVYVKILATEDECQDDTSLNSNSVNSIEMRLAQASELSRTYSISSDSSPRTRKTDNENYSHFEYTAPPGSDSIVMNGFLSSGPGSKGGGTEKERGKNQYVVSGPFDTAVQPIHLKGASDASDRWNPAISHYSYQSIESDTVAASCT